MNFDELMSWLKFILIFVGIPILLIASCNSNVKQRNKDLKEEIAEYVCDDVRDSIYREYENGLIITDDIDLLADIIAEDVWISIEKSF